jgi:hypothetical protein
MRMAMLQTLMHRVGRVLRALFGLALMAGALAIGLLVAAAVLVRLAWRRRDRGRVQPATVRRSAAATGEVVDAEYREIPRTASTRPVA